MIGGRMTITDGKARMPGIDHGGLGTVLAQNDDVVAVKWPGHYYWGDQLNPRKWASPVVVVYRIVDLYLNSGDLKVDGLIEWKVGRKP